MSRVVWVPGKDCSGTVNLLGKNQSGQGVCHGHWPKRKKQLCTLPGRRGPAVRGTDSKNKVLRALVSAFAHPGREGLGSHLTAAAVKEDGNGGGSTLKLLNPREQRLLVSKAFGTTFGEWCTALEVKVG